MAAYVGIGMAVTIVGSFMLIIPIEFDHLAAGAAVRAADRLLRERPLEPAQRTVAAADLERPRRRRSRPASRWPCSSCCSRRCSSSRTAATPTSTASTRTATRSRRPARPAPTACTRGTWLAGRGPDLAAAGAVDASTFTGFYWSEQFRTAATVFVLTVVGGVGGAVLYGVAGPKAAARQPDAVTPAA